MFLRQPFDQEIKASPAALRTDTVAPAGPVLDQAVETDETDEVAIINLNKPKVLKTNR